MAAPLCDGESNRLVATRLDAFPRPPALIHARIHLVPAESRYQTQLSGSARLYRPVPPLGVDGLQPCPSRHCSQG